MKRSIVAALLALSFSLEAGATLTPVGSYTLTFSRKGWSVSQTIPVSMMTPTKANGVDFYNVNGKMTQAYMESIAMPGDPSSQRFTWYVNSPAVKNDLAKGSLLQGTGPLTITISHLNFAGLSPDEVVFLPQVTHVYYVNYNAAGYSPLALPGGIDVDPGDTQIQRSPIRPLDEDEPGWGIFPNNAYGYPCSFSDDTGLTVILPNLYVPYGANWEVSFGMGFEGVSSIPEPITLLTLCLGFFAVRKKF